MCTRMSSSICWLLCCREINAMLPPVDGLCTAALPICILPCKHNTRVYSWYWPLCLLHPIISSPFCPFFHVLFISHSSVSPYPFLVCASCSTSSGSCVILLSPFPSCPPSFSPFCLSQHLPYFTVAFSQANNQLINQLSPRILVAALRGAL